MNCVWPNAPAQEPLNSCGVDVAVIENFQRRHQLFFEVFVAARGLAHQRRQRLHHRALAEILAEIRLDAPHRDDDSRIDAEAPLRRPQRARVLLQQRAALVDALLVDQRGDVIPHRRRKLRLLVHEAHGVVRLETAERAGNGLLGHSGRGGGMAQASKARAPFRPRGRGEKAKGGEDSGKEASIVHGGDNSPSRLTRDNYPRSCPQGNRATDFVLAPHPDLPPHPEEALKGPSRRMSNVRAARFLFLPMLRDAPFGRSSA